MERNIIIIITTTCNDSIVINNIVLVIIMVIAIIEKRLYKIIIIIIINRLYLSINLSIYVALNITYCPHPAHVHLCHKHAAVNVAAISPFQMTLWNGRSPTVSFLRT